MSKYYGWKIMAIVAIYLIGIVACYTVTVSSVFAQSADIIVKTSKPPKHTPKPPQNQGQAQGQHQGQAQGQHQTASAVNEGVSAIAEGATVNQSVNTDIPKVTLGLGGAVSYSAIASSPCLKPKEGLGARNINILGAFAKSELLVTDADCWKRKDRELDLLERQIALEERKLGMGDDLRDCQSNLVAVAGGLEKCQAAFDDVAEGK